MGVKIKRERPDQRRHHRVTAPLFVGVGGHTVRVSDWSLGGLKVEKFPGPMPRTGETLELKLTLPFQGFDVQFAASGRVLRTNAGEGMFAVQFTEIGERERELMSHFLEELVRGSMSDVEDTIQRIDVPVTPASLQPDSKLVPVTAKPIARMPVKTAAMLALYAVIGLVVLSYAGLLVYSNFYRLEVQSAVIAAPIESVKAHADGEVRWAGVKPGDQIRQGDVLLEVIDHQLEREIELSDIAIKERKARLGFLKQRYIGELEKLEGLTSLEMRDMKQLKLEIEASEAAARAARRQFERLTQLHAKGFATDARVEDAEKEAVRAEKALAAKRIELATRTEIAGSNFGKRHYNGRDIIGDQGDVEAEIRLAENEILLAQQRHIANQNMRAHSAVKAPFTGTVLDLPRVDSAAVRRGDVVAIIEQRQKRHILAFMKQDEVSRVGLGDVAQVYIPALGEKITARIASIDRTSGFIEEESRVRLPGYRWRGSEDRSARVVLEFTSPHVLRNAERYRSGLPATVLFEQRSVNPLIGASRDKNGAVL
ncbi:MAG: HlyD family efflux transporter periplasmic adaptor subunit [Hyphomicrobiaceae bacterium]